MKARTAFVWAFLAVAYLATAYRIGYTAGYHACADFVVERIERIP